MKFGCMGDPVNLASRLEGLCKADLYDWVCLAQLKVGSCLADKRSRWQDHKLFT